MKKLLILLTLISSPSFADEFVCEKSSQDIKRCENEEVICYSYGRWDRGGLSCKFKD